MLDFPDTEAAMSLQNAALDDAQATVARIVDEGVYEAPSEYQDLALLKAIGHQAYLRGRSTGLPDARLDLLQRLVDEADALQAEVQAGSAPPPPAETPPTMAEPPPAPMQGPPESSISAAVPSDLPV
jgi:MoxR-like ATPase